MGVGAGALGLVLSGATSGVSVSGPTVTMPAKSAAGSVSSTQAPSAVKKVEKKIKKLKDGSGYDLSLEAEVKSAESEAKAAAKVSVT